MKALFKNLFLSLRLFSLLRQQSKAAWRQLVLKRTTPWQSIGLSVSLQFGFRVHCTNFCEVVVVIHVDACKGRRKNLNDHSPHKETVRTYIALCKLLGYVGRYGQQTSYVFRRRCVVSQSCLYIHVVENEIV